MGQCTSKHEQQKAVAVVGRSRVASAVTHNMERGPSDSSMSIASSTMHNLAQYLAENPEKVGVNAGGKQKKRGSFVLRDSASSPAGEDMSCSATTLNMSMELSDRSSLWMTGSTSNRSRSPKRNSSSMNTSASTLHSRRSANRSPKRNISNESNASRNSAYSSGGHCWAALRDTTDRDYTNRSNTGVSSDVNQLDPFGLDTLPEELAIRQQPSVSTNINEQQQGEQVTVPAEEKEKEGLEEVQPVVGTTEEKEEVNNTECREEKEEDNDTLNKNSASSSALRRRRSRRRSRRDWQRSSGVYVPPSNSQQQQGSSSTKQASYRRTGTEESIDPAKLKEGKESSWQALSCTSRHSDSYTSYASSNISYLTFNDSSGNKVDLGKYQKDAMGNMHGFCWTESEGDDSSLEDLTEGEEEDEEEVTNREVEDEIKFWETNVLRS